MEDALKLKIKTLPFGTEEMTCHVDESFFDGIEVTEVRRAAVDVTLRVTRLGESDYRLSIACRGTLTVPCDRCLDDLLHEVDATYDVAVRQEGDVVDDSTDGVLLVPASWHELDVSGLVRDTVLLTLPITHCHASEDECNSEMMSLLDSHSGGGDEGGDADDEAAIDPRWAALSKLRREEK